MKKALIVLSIIAALLGVAVALSWIYVIQYEKTPSGYYYKEIGLYFRKIPTDSIDIPYELEISRDEINWERIKLLWPESELYIEHTGSSTAPVICYTPSDSTIYVTYGVNWSISVNDNSPSSVEVQDITFPDIPEVDTASLFRVRYVPIQDTYSLTLNGSEKSTMVTIPSDDSIKGLPTLPELYYRINVNKGMGSLTLYGPDGYFISFGEPRGLGIFSFLRFI